MKKISIIAIATVFISLSSSAQFGVDVGAGVTVEKPTPAAELNLHYNFSVLNISAGYIAALSRSVKDGALFNVRVGKQFWLDDAYYINPTIGYSHLLRSVDQKNLNQSYPIFGLGIYRQTRIDELQVYLAGTSTGKMTFITFGIRGLIL